MLNPIKSARDILYKLVMQEVPSWWLEQHDTFVVLHKLWGPQQMMWEQLRKSLELHGQW